MLYYFTCPAIALCAGVWMGVPYTNALRFYGFPSKLYFRASPRLSRAPTQNLQKPTKNQYFPPKILSKLPATFPELSGRSQDYLKSIFSVSGPLKINFFCPQTKKINIFCAWTNENKYFLFPHHEKSVFSVPGPLKINILSPQTTKNQHFWSPDH